MSRAEKVLDLVSRHPYASGASVSASLVAVISVAVPMLSDAAAERHKEMIRQDIKPEVRIMIPASGIDADADYDRFGAFVDQGYVLPASERPKGDDWSNVLFTGKDGVESHLDLTPDMMERADLAALQVRAEMIMLDYVANHETLFDKGVSSTDFAMTSVNLGREEALSMVSDLKDGKISSSAFTRFSPAPGEDLDPIVMNSGGSMFGVAPSHKYLDADEYVRMAADGRAPDVSQVVTGSHLYVSDDADREFKVGYTTRSVEEVLRSRIVQDEDFVHPHVASLEAQDENMAISIVEMTNSRIASIKDSADKDFMEIAQTSSKVKSDVIHEFEKTSFDTRAYFEGMISESNAYFDENVSDTNIYFDSNVSDTNRYFDDQISESSIYFDALSASAGSEFDGMRDALLRDGDPFADSTEDGLNNIEKERTQSLASISAEKASSISSIEAERGQAIASIEAERSEAISSIEAERSQAISSIEADMSQAFESISADKEKSLLRVDDEFSVKAQEAYATWSDLEDMTIREEAEILLYDEARFRENVSFMDENSDLKIGSPDRPTPQAPYIEVSKTRSSGLGVVGASMQRAGIDISDISPVAASETRPAEPAAPDLEDDDGPRLD